MKRFIYLFALASLFACSSKEELSPPSNRIELVSKTSENIKLGEGRTIGVTITSSSGNYVNRPWTVIDGTLTADPAPNWEDSDITISAYHPYDETWGDDYFDFTVSSDQSESDEGTGFQDSDLMWCSTPAGQEDGTVTLNFTHLLSKIEVILDIPDATVFICNTMGTVQFHPVYGYLSGAYGDKLTITAKVGVTTEEKMTASAIIVPQWISAGTKFIRVETADKTYYYSLESDVTFESGQTYKYELTLPTDGTRVMSVRRL